MMKSGYRKVYGDDGVFLGCVWTLPSGGWVAEDREGESEVWVHEDTAVRWLAFKYAFDNGLPYTSGWNERGGVVTPRP